MSTSTPMTLGMVGLGRMGANMVRRVMRDGHSAVVFDTNPDNVAALVAEGLRISRGGTEVLRGVDLTLRAGERVALTGPSGSGKTVLLSVLAGFSEPEAGTVRLDGRPVLGARSPARERLGVVFQGYGLVALLTAAENVELALTG